MTKKAEHTVSLDVPAFNRGVETVLKLKPLRTICSNAVHGVKPSGHFKKRTMREVLYGQKQSA